MPWSIGPTVAQFKFVFIFSFLVYGQSNESILQSYLSCGTTMSMCENAFNVCVNLSVTVVPAVPAVLVPIVAGMRLKSLFNFDRVECLLSAFQHNIIVEVLTPYQQRCC